MRAVLLGEAATTVMGQAPPGKDCNKEGRGTVFVKAGEFNGRTPVVREWTTKPLKIAKASDVLVCVVGATARKVSGSIDCAIGRSVAAVRPDPTMLDTEYLYHFLSTHTGALRAKSQGLAQGVITREMLEDTPLPLPPLDEQRRIAAILDQADDLRRKRRQALDRIQQLPSAIFYRIFGDPTTNPMGWPEHQCADLCDRLTVGIVVKPASYYVEQGVPAIRGLNIKPTGIEFSDCVYISEASNERLSSSRVWRDDVVVVRSGRPGQAAVVPEELNGANSIDIIIATPNKSRIRPRFLRDYINSPDGKKIVLSESRGQVQQHFNVGSLSKSKIFAPPLALQQEYEVKLDAIEEQTAMLKMASSKTDALFASLQHRVFRGEL